jgi:hypothetical protein
MRVSNQTTMAESNYIESETRTLREPDQIGETNLSVAARRSR